MGADSKIEWTHHTFNPWVGCTQVGPGCDHCYAESWAKRTGGPLWGAGSPRRRTTETYWKQPIRWNRQAESQGERRRVFCASLADVFDNSVSSHWRADLWKMILKTPALDWLLLTKRIGNAASMLPPLEDLDPPPWWLLATVVNQAEADRDIPKLLTTPAKYRGLSMEPLLGPVDLDQHLPALDWVIVGGESGPGARPMHPVWVRDIRDQCQAAGVAFFFKQWGDWGPLPSDYTKTPQLTANGLYRVGKKSAGRLLDGQEWSEYPAVLTEEVVGYGQ